MASTTPATSFPRSPRLNPEQAKALRHRSGPLLIVAGAGTGKTHVLTQRFLTLVDASRGVTPGNILALTFSRAAATEMKARIEALLGTPPPDLWITTFHGFCHRVLSDHAPRVGLPRRVALWDAVDQWVVLRGLLPTLSALQDLPGRAAEQVSGLLRFITRAKDELATPQDVRAYSATLPPEAGARYRAAAEAYQAYQDALARTGGLDFGELLLTTIRLLRDDPSMLAAYRRQFAHVLVDEFQDTNVAQIELLWLLAGPKGNVCVVGDDDQAIYRFRGASYASFLIFRERFPHATTLRLVRNYRSTPEILQGAERLIAVNGPDRFDPEKILEAQRPRGPSIEVRLSRSPEEEARVVTEAILERVRGPDGRLDPVRCRELAVLYRAHHHKDLLVQSLEQQGIPYTVAGRGELLQREAVRDLVALLTVVTDPEDSVALFRVLSVPIFDVDPMALVQASAQAHRQGRDLFTVLRETAPERRTAGVHRCLALVRRAMAGSARQPVAQVLRLLVEDSGYLKWWMLQGGRAGEQAVRDVGALLRLADRFTEQHVSPTVRVFLEYLEAMAEVGADRWEEDLGDDAAGVRLMTVHRAKGLEFRVVMILGLAQRRFPSAPQPELLPFPAELRRGAVPAGDAHLQEERRLCYVAVTRAEEHLYLSCVERPRQRRSAFVREMLGEAGPPPPGSGPPPAGARQEPELPGSPQGAAALARWRRLGRVLEAAESAARQSGDVSVDLRRAIRTAVRHIVDGPLESAPSSSAAIRAVEVPWRLPPGHVLSYSQVDQYRVCPLKYKFSYVLKIPVRAGAALRYGDDMHRTLEAFYRGLMEGARPSLRRLHRLFAEQFSAGRYPSGAEERRYRQRGIQELDAFYRAQQRRWIVPLAVERAFTVTVAGHPFRGVMDRIDQRPDGTVEIIDYKTGALRREREPRRALQLDLYALACREAFGLEPSALTLYSLTTQRTVTHAPAERGIEAARAAVREVVAGLEAGRFEPAVGRHCAWCDFRRLCPAWDR